MLLLILSLFHLAQDPRTAPTTAPSAFVGTWVGTETWALDSPPPSAKEEQEVTLAIELKDGRLAGTMTPFFGGVDGAAFSDGEIVDGRLRASARMGAPKGDEPAAGSRNQPRGWKDGVRIQFAFEQDRNTLTGTADVDLNGVKWIKYKYDLGRKRSRY